MRPSTPLFAHPLKKLRLVLVGGGHSHVQVLRRRMMRPDEGAHLAVTLIAREVQTPYSGMLPGRVAGRYEHDEMHIDLAKLCRAADAELVIDEVVALDLESKQVFTQSHPPLRCDALSLNSGAVPGIDGVEIAGPVTPVKPIGRFLAAWPAVQSAFESALNQGQSPRLAVVGAGAGGVELILAISKQFENTSLNLTLIEAGKTILPGHSKRVRRWVEAELEAAKVTMLKGFQVVKVASNCLVSESGEKIHADHALWTTGVAAPRYPQDSGLQVDASGFVKVNDRLQSLSHQWVFAAGDVAALERQPRPKSGVYAVRAGPVLAENLLRYSQSAPLKRYRAQKQALAIIGNSRGRAVASRGRLFAAGRPLSWLKARIDHRFMARFVPPPMADEADALVPEDTTMRCAGCGSKLPAHLISRVLGRLDVHPETEVPQGIGEDAAIIQIGTHTEKGTHTLCVSTDHFPQMVSDTYLFGRIAAHHGLSDLFAMGALPRYALVNLSVKLMAPRLMEEDAFLALKGANDVFRESGVHLVGGHSTESDMTQLGCTVFGELRSAPFVKSGLEANDLLVLTKPLGVGVLLAGEMRTRTPGRCFEAALASMNQSNGRAALMLREHGGESCTDVTGFGLLGHLLEMLNASDKSAEIWLDQVPALDGACHLMREGVESSLQQANEAALEEVELSGIEPSSPALRLLMDPQTSGGMLFGIAEAKAQSLIAALRTSGYTEASIIGRIRESAAGDKRACVRIIESIN